MHFKSINACLKACIDSIIIIMAEIPKPVATKLCTDPCFGDFTKLRNVRKGASVARWRFTK